MIDDLAAGGTAGEELLRSGLGSPEEACLRVPRAAAEGPRRAAAGAAAGAGAPCAFPRAETPACDRPAAARPSRPPRIPGYEVEAELGRGGMGVVYRARHLRLNRSSPSRCSWPATYARPTSGDASSREAEAVAGLRHPNIVQVHEVGERDGLPYFTMEIRRGRQPGPEARRARR